jgi:S-adenosylmethionine:tRNA ribosyltransferase-isomerase
MNRLGIDESLRVSDFDFHLPEELIAQEPIAERDHSRLLVVDRITGALTDTSVQHLPEYLRPGDLLVGNNSRVIPARFWARKIETHGSIEILLLRSTGDDIWEALAKPAKRLSPGTDAVILDRQGGEAIDAGFEVVGRGEHGQVLLRFTTGADQRLEEFGVMPLPPYIHTRLADANRYQTLYASQPGSAAAPTAGLHITPRLLDECKAVGASWAEVTLHIGLDTFRPVAVERVADHVIHSEWCSVSDETAEMIAETKRKGGRVIPVGTTSARTLETLGKSFDISNPKGFSAPTSIFITPGYQWTIVDALLTNFHLPRSTLIMMVSSLAGKSAILNAYQHAIDDRYRFFSFGDAMLIV